MRRRVVIVLVMVLVTVPLVGVVAPPSAAARTVWTPSRSLDRWGEDAAVAANRSGDAVAVWGSQGLVLGAFRPSGGTWGAPAPVSDQPVEYVGQPRAVLDEAGQATVTWTVFDGGPNGYYGDMFDLYAAVGRAGAPWSRPQQLARQVGWAPAPLAADRSGTVSVAWETFEGCVDQDGAMCTPEESAAGRYHVMVASKSRTGHWSAPVDLGEGDSPILASGATGRLDAVWLTRPARGSPAGAVTAATRSDGGWSARTTLGSGASSASPPALVADERGLTAGWSVCDGSEVTLRCRHQAATRSAGGGWGTATTLSERRGAEAVGSPVVLAVDEPGRVTALWTLDVLVSAQRDDAGWTPPARVSVVGAEVDGPGLAVDRAGNAVATWTSRKGSASFVLAAHRPVDGAWTRPVLLDLPAGTSNQYHPTTHVVAVGAEFAVVHDVGGVMVTDRVDDRTAPVARMRGAYVGVVTRARAQVSWLARDTDAGVDRVQVRRRTASYRSSFGGWSYLRKDASTGSATLAGRPGRTYCLSVRARDRAGNWSAWSRDKCVSTPVDDRALRASGGMRRVRTAATSYRRTETRATRSGAALSLTGVRGRRLYVVATTCPRCGTVVVRLGGLRLATVSLRSGTVRHRRLLPVRSFSRTRSGTLTVRVTSAGRPVSIDGVVAAR